jgi:hypothetical protein
LKNTARLNFLELLLVEERGIFVWWCSAGHAMLDLLLLSARGDFNSEDED